MRGIHIKKWALAAGLLLFLLLGGSRIINSKASGQQPIQLMYATFDPFIQGEPTVPANLQARSDTPFVLLQLKGPMQADWAADFQAAGVRFVGYLPVNTYLVELTGDGRSSIESHSAVRWLGSYHPAYKLSQTVSNGRLAVQLFPKANLAQTAQAFESAGATIVEQNSHANLLIVNTAEALIPVLAQNEAVLWIQNVVQMQELNDDVRWVSQADIPFTTPLYERGLTGAGQVAAAADSGISVYDFSGNADPSVPSCFFLDDANNGNGGPALPPSQDHRKVIDYTIPEGATSDMVDGSGHGSHVVGSIVGDQPPWNVPSPGDGQAFQARVYFQDIGLGDIIGTINPPSDYHVLFEAAYDPNGDGIYDPANEPRTHSNSWGGTDPIYSLEAAQTDDFMWSHPDFLILFAAGNQGPGPNTIGQPATAKNIVTVGGTENGLADPNSMGYFSSHGPAPLGRMKPTISAPGDRVTSVLRGDPCGTTEKSGTSMATPTVQGLALLMRQYLWDGFYPSGTANPADRIHPSSALLKGLLINSGRPMDGAHTDNAAGASWPSNGQGWGRVTADDVLYFQGDQRALWLHDEYALDGSVGFDASGQSRTFTFTVADSQPFTKEPFEVTLSWTDYPGLPPAGGALINNLDLTVTGPNGAVYIGNDVNSNDFKGLSDLPPVTPDVVNPWEVIYLENPQPGDYTVTVTAANIASIVLDPGRKQGFALVVTGDLLSEQGRADIQYPEYEANPLDIAQLRISDSGLNISPTLIDSVTAVVTNGPTNVDVTLNETAADSGIFSGQILLSSEITTSDALLVAPGDTVKLTYVDANNGQGGNSQVVDTAKIAKRPINFINPPDLNDPGGTDADGVYDLTWNPVEETNQLIGYVIQETTAFSMPLNDDGEGLITDNWTTGQLLAEWSNDTQYYQSGSGSFWSGRGDSYVLIDSALTLNHAVLIPTTVSSAQLSFYSRYFNDFNDYGHVEISVNGGSWQRLRRLYADPRLIPMDGRMQYHQFDLSDYIGQPLRVRFRFDNGVFSSPPDSPGWWIDDVVISGGSWQTIAITPANASSFTINGRLADAYAYRVRGLFVDGTVSGWSQVVDMISEATTLPPTPTNTPTPLPTVTTTPNPSPTNTAEPTSTNTPEPTPTAPPPNDDGAKTTGGGWLHNNSGKKLNFGFNIQEDESGLRGNLQLNDKTANVKIHVSDITAVNAVSSACGTVPNGANAVEFQGTGTYNGSAGAAFRVCVQDNAEPGGDNDLFYLECVTGCQYNTADRTADDIIDGGNIQVRNQPGNSAAKNDYVAKGQQNNGQNQAATLILDPLLITEGVIGQLQQFTVKVYDQNQDLMVGVQITLQQTAADGSTTYLTTQTDLMGNAVFNLVNLDQTTEYLAIVNAVSSNSILLDPVSD